MSIERAANFVELKINQGYVVKRDSCGPYVNDPKVRGNFGVNIVGSTSKNYFIKIRN